MSEGDDAFISYSHAADARLALALERGLERLARPWNRLRAMSVFRDETDLSLNPDLWGTISGRLNSSRFLVLLACPESAASQWVNREVAHWCDLNGTDRLLLVWTGGELAWDNAAQDFTGEPCAVPEALLGRFAGEPLYLDLRWAREETELTLKQSRFRSAVAHIAAPIRNVPPDELEGEDIRLHRRAQRLARGATVALVALSVTATIAAMIAVSNANRADQRTREAVARQVGLAALDLPATEIDQALLMSLASSRLADSNDPHRFNPTQVLIGRYSRLRSMHHLGDVEGFINVRGLGLSADGTAIYATAGRADGSMALATWTTGSAQMVELVDLPPGVGSGVDTIDDGTQVIVGRRGASDGDIAGSGDGGGGSLRRQASGVVVPITGSIMNLDRSSEIAWLLAGNDTVSLVSLNSGAVQVSIAGGPETLTDVGPRRAVALVGDRLSMFDAATGAALASASGVPSGFAIAAGSSNDTAVVEATTDGHILRWVRVGDQLMIEESLATPTEIGRPLRLALSPRRERFVVVGTAGSALVEFGSGNVVLTHGGGATVVEADPSGRFVALGGSRLSVWDLETGQRTIATPQVASALAWSGPCDQEPGCKLVAAGISIDVIDPINETQTRLVEEIGAQAVAISRDGALVVSGGWGTTVAVWSVEPIVDDSNRQQLADANETAPATGSDCGSGLTAASPGGGYVVAVDPSKAVTALCRTGDDGTRIALNQLNPAAGTVTAVAVDDDGSVALGRASGIVEYFTVEGGQFQNGTAVDVRVGGEQVHITALAARGGVVVAGIRFPQSSSTPGRVMIWRLDQQEPTTFATDFSDVAAVAVLDATASAVIVAGRDSTDGPVTVQIWETVSRRRVGRAFTGLEGDVATLIGLETAVEGTDRSGRSFRWHLDLDPAREVCAIVARPLSEEEWNVFADGALGRYTFDPPCN
jgi:WD40 repeat protein